jgi:hypothetical protein
VTLLFPGNQRPGKLRTRVLPLRIPAVSPDRTKPNLPEPEHPVLPEPTGEAKPQPPQILVPSDPRPFSRGEMVFYSDRVELHVDGVPVKIIGDTGEGHSRNILDLLRHKRADGRFVRMGGEKIVAAINKNLGEAKVGIGTVTGCAKTIRGNIRERLKRELNVVCEDWDVLVNDDQGYHLNDDKITVRDGRDDGPVLVGQAGTRTDVPAGTLDVPVLVPGDKTHVPANVPVDTANERQAWIMAETADSGTVTRREVEQRFGVSAKTAKRDLGELARQGRLEFVGKPPPGFYRRPPAA